MSHGTLPEAVAATPRVEVMTGNTAVAYGVLLSRVQVVAIFPITPQTTIGEKIASFVASGKLRAKVILPENEHSVMGACIGASATGARSFTATSSQGLALMCEHLHYASGCRLPIVMANCSRALAAPWNAWCDHSDSLSQRDAGWLQLYCEHNQEVLDTVIMAFKIAERVLLPVMVMLDGFILSHTAEAVQLPSQQQVDRFLPPYHPQHRLDPDHPYTIGTVVGPEWFTEIKLKAQQAMEAAREEIKRVDDEFGAHFGRSYGGVTEEYRTEDAEVALVTYATVTSTARQVVDELREQGVPVGLMKIKAFRPFPLEEVRDLALRVPKLAVIDRNISLGHGGIFCQEIRGALHSLRERPAVFGYIAGLGGRDITPATIREVVERTRREEAPSQDAIWLEVKT